MKMPTVSFSGKVRDMDMLGSVVTIRDDTEVLVDNCRRITECSDVRCSLVSGNYTVEVWGSGLSASGFSNGSASVSGRVQSVALTRRRSGKAGDV